MRTLVYGLVFATIFAIAAAVVGFLFGYWRGLDYEAVTGYSGGNGPLLFIFIAPLGAIIGFFFGLWFESKART